jgi:natural product precursor
LEKKLEAKKLRLQKETIREITSKDLSQIAGGWPPEHQCACTTDYSNACCGPNGSC